MSYFGKSDWDYLLYEMEKFLKEHNITDLLKIVEEAVSEKEEGYL